MTVKGIDVSSVQSSSFSTSGLAFCFVKATEGRTYVNPKQTSQAAHARKAGLVVGFYHFLWPGNIAQQAAYFVEKCASTEGDILAVDWETTTDGTAADCADKDTFVAAVKHLRPTHRVILYCNRDFWVNRDTTSNAGDGLWIAQYGVPAGRPDITADWLFHQYTDSPVDTNVGRFADGAALRAWAGGGAANPPARPEVSLKNVVAAAKKDPKAAQGHTTHAEDVKPVEAALRAEGLLSATYASDGSFGSRTVEAYAAWQRSLGYRGEDADGVPGGTSLKKLGAKHGFTVTT